MTGIGDCASLIETRKAAARKERIKARMLLPASGINSRQSQRLSDRGYLLVDLRLVVRDRGLLTLHFLGERDDLLLLALGFLQRFGGRSTDTESDQTRGSEDW